jgi:hypothetical protein
LQSDRPGQRVTIRRQTGVVAVPIDLTLGCTDDLYLVLFGTGLRYRDVRLGSIGCED